LLEAMEESGVSGLRLQSAYRTYSYQRSVFNQKVKELTAKGHNKYEVESIASKSVQPPGASEHQLGLALDVSIDGKLTQAFGETQAGIWLEENCHRYGFIIRYPNAKTEITQIVYEPWHLRYVGEPHAAIMKDLGITLEEYLGYIRRVGAYIFWINDRDYYLLCYSSFLPESLPMEVVDVSSFNATGGEYIITMRKTYPNVWSRRFEY